MVQQYVGGSIQLAYVSTTHTEETPKIFMERQTLHNSVWTSVVFRMHAHLVFPNTSIIHRKHLRI